MPMHKEINVFPNLSTDVSASGHLVTNISYDTPTSYFGMPSGNTAGMVAGGAVALGGAAYVRLKYKQCQATCLNKEPPKGIFSMIKNDVGGGLMSMGSAIKGGGGSGEKKAPLNEEAPDMPGGEYVQQIMIKNIHICKQVCGIQMKINGLMTAIAAIGAGLATRHVVNRRRARQGSMLDPATLAATLGVLSQSGLLAEETRESWDKFLGDLRQQQTNCDEMKGKEEEMSTGQVFNKPVEMDEPFAEPEPATDAVSRRKQTIIDFL